MKTLLDTFWGDVVRDRDISDDVLRDAWERFDVNGDDELSQREFISFAKYLWELVLANSNSSSQPLTDQECIEAFHLLLEDDLNQDHWKTMENQLDFSFMLLSLSIGRHGAEFELSEDDDENSDGRRESDFDREDLEDYGYELLTRKKNDLIFQPGAHRFPRGNSDVSRGRYGKEKKKLTEKNDRESEPVAIPPHRFPDRNTVVFRSLMEGNQLQRCVQPGPPPPPLERKGHYGGFKAPRTMEERSKSTPAVPEAAVSMSQEKGECVDKDTVAVATRKNPRTQDTMIKAVMTVTNTDIEKENKRPWEKLLKGVWSKGSKGSMDSEQQRDIVENEHQKTSADKSDQTDKEEFYNIGLLLESSFLKLNKTMLYDKKCPINLRTIPWYRFPRHQKPESRKVAGSGPIFKFNKLPALGVLNIQPSLLKHIVTEEPYVPPAGFELMQLMEGSMFGVSMFCDRKDDHEVVGCCLEANDAYVVFFRGTLFGGEAIANLKAALSSCPDVAGHIHHGFGNIYTRGPNVREQIKSILDQIRHAPNNKQIIISGHSLGAALATLAMYDAMRLYPELGPRLIMCTFGSPRVGSSTFATAFDELVTQTCASVFRLVNEYDLIPKVPGKLFYTHVGGQVSFNLKLASNFGGGWLDNHLLAYSSWLGRHDED